MHVDSPHDSDCVSSRRRRTNENAIKSNWMEFDENSLNNLMRRGASVKSKLPSLAVCSVIINENMNQFKTDEKLKRIVPDQTRQINILSTRALRKIASKFVWKIEKSYLHIRRSFT